MSVTPKQELSAGVGDYDIDSIGTVRDLELVRLRPMLYLRDVEESGQVHTGFEIIDNTIDEAASMGNIASVPITILMCRDPQRKTYQMVVRDAGRGIPIGTNSAGINVFLNATTVLNSSAKFGKNKAYVASGGLNGVGVKLAGGTSFIFRAISHRPEQTASILVRQGKHEKKDIRTPGPWRGGLTGVTVAYEPDKEIFQSIEQFAESGYIAIIERLKRYVFFRKYNISFYISETPLPEKFWTAPAFEAEDILDNVIASANKVWTAGEGYDQDQWLKSHFNITRPIAWNANIAWTNPVMDERLKDVILRLFYVKFERSGGRMSLVNNIPVDDPGSYQFTILQDVLSRHLAPLVQDKKIREFCAKHYKLPLFVAMDVKFDGAKFIGNTKEQFRDSDFRGPFRSMLDEYVSSPAGVEMMKQLYTHLEEDIKQKYAESLGNKTSVKPVGRLFELLKKPQNFFNCSSRTGYKELFLVEGESAGGCNKYDKSYQALYLMAGKPANGLKMYPPGTPKAYIANELFNHPVYSDLFTIINYNPMKPNLSDLTFSRVSLLTDADAHGGHIASLVLGNIAAVAPELIDHGLFSIIVPPYYRVSVGKHDYYVRGKGDLVQWKARNFYKEVVKIDIATVNNRFQLIGEPKELDTETFIDFVCTVDRVGNMILNISNELSIDPNIIESLSQVSLYLTPETMNTEMIKEAIAADHVTYDTVSNTLLVNIGRDDLIIPLMKVSERLYRDLRPMLTKVRKASWVPLVTTIRTNLYDKLPMTIYQVFDLFRRIDDLVHMDVEVLKGIGSMEEDDIGTVCMDPKTRHEIRIENVGDLARIHNLLGRDSGFKKQLVAAPLGAGNNIFR